MADQNSEYQGDRAEEVKLLRSILRSLRQAVISTDPNGTIIQANESAKTLLGLAQTDVLEGESIYQWIIIEQNNFRQWLDQVLQAKDEHNPQSYYPDQSLRLVSGENSPRINLSINALLDSNDPTRMIGALVMMEELDDEKRLKSTMYRYMTQELAEQLLENRDAARMGGDVKEVSILFADIHDYQALAERMSAEATVEMLNAYFETMVDAVFQHQGTVDKYIGDAIMAVFGSPLPLEDHAWKAVQTAIEMRDRLIHLNAEFASSEQPTIQVGIGINTATVAVGNIGSPKRMEYTAVGDGVNLSSLLQSSTKEYGCDIIIGKATYESCGDRIQVRNLGSRRLKGRYEPVELYELVGLA